MSLSNTDILHSIDNCEDFTTLAIVIKHCEDRKREIIHKHQAAKEYFEEYYFNLDNAVLHNCPKCGAKATHRVSKKGNWACGCFECKTYKCSYDHIKAIQAWEDYCAEYNDWIPVNSGRLPEIGSKVIITDSKGHVWENVDYDYGDDEDITPLFHQWDNEGFQCFKPDVIAWRPRPRLQPFIPEETQAKVKDKKTEEHNYESTSD